MMYRYILYNQLIHGFGFAGVLQEFFLHLLRNKFETRRIIIGASTVIFIIGLIWLVERVTNLQLVPF
ncbi:hypothetical protein [Paenibacillus prosopidis]|uniref:hypothetical protein n=1 Tax=Paenibacillus prosopidis TaxID=630520 RepID=UPI0011C02966|nr:hypothetical protein [Paenibacillus prosopidis]